MGKKGYTIIKNEILQDDPLSLKARGLYSFMKSLPDTWEYSKAGLLSRIPDGIRSLESGLEELKKHGYLEIIPERKPNGQISYKYILKEPP